MGTHQSAKNREYEHHGITFKVIPGSQREKLLLDMFQAHDRAASKPGIVDPQGNGDWFMPLIVGALSGLSIGVFIGWWIV